jgi:hypothetical protein
MGSGRQKALAGRKDYKNKGEFSKKNALGPFP